MAGQMANQMGGIGQQTSPAPQPAATVNPGGTPPPLPGQQMFHVDHGGTPGGPYNMTQMQQGIQSGQVTGQTLVWAQGMAAWAPAQTVPELQALFAAPPPMPPTNPTPPPVPPPPASPTA